MLHSPGAHPLDGRQGHCDRVHVPPSPALTPDRRPAPSSAWLNFSAEPIRMARPDHAAAQWSGCGLPPHGDRPQLRPSLPASIYERPDDPDFEPYTHVLRPAREPAPPHRRSIVEVPLGLDHPYWIADPDFDLDYHIRNLALPAPGNAEQLTEQVARIGRRLRPQPPTVGGVRHRGLGGRRLRHPHEDPPRHRRRRLGVELLTIMLDADPEGAKSPPATPWEIDSVPVVARAAAPGERQPDAQPGPGQPDEPAGDERGGQGPRRVGGVAEDIDGLRRRLPRAERGDEGEQHDMAAAVRAPQLRRRRSTRRSLRHFAIGSMPLDQVKTIQNHLGSLLNDVVMAVCAGALRRYLEELDALTAPLVAMVPVSNPRNRQVDQPRLRSARPVAHRPRGSDPAHRRRRPRTMQQAKEQFDLMPVVLLIVEMNQFASRAGHSGHPPGGGDAHRRPHQLTGEPGHLERAGATTARCTWRVPGSSTSTRCPR